MVELRITKYSPALRDLYGRYTRDEWTSVSDVGRDFGQGVVTLEEYLTIENQYVSVVEQLMQIAGITELCITDLECKTGNFIGIPTALREECQNDLKLIRSNLKPIQIGKTLDLELIPKVVRLCLREVIWCRLIGQHNFYVHFGYDYYMYAGFDGEMDEIQNISTPLFIEQFISPYHPEKTVMRVILDKNTDTAIVYLASIPPDGIAKTYTHNVDASGTTFKLNYDKDNRLIYIEANPASIGLSNDLLDEAEVY